MSPTWHRLIFWRFVISRMAAKAISSIWATALAILFGKLSKLQEPSPVIRFRQLNPREEPATRQDWSHPARRQEKFWVGIRSTQVWKKSLATLGDGTRIIRMAMLKHKGLLLDSFSIHLYFIYFLQILSSITNCTKKFVQFLFKKPKLCGIFENLTLILRGCYKAIRFFSYNERDSIKSLFLKK